MGQKALPPKYRLGVIATSFIIHMKKCLKRRPMSMWDQHLTQKLSLFSFPKGISDSYTSLSLP